MISSRVLTIFFIFVFLFFFIGVKLFTIQVSNHEKYSRIASRQHTKSEILKARRGVIKDRNGTVLAYSKNNVSLFVDTKMARLKTRKKLAGKFAKVFGKDSLYYLNKMNKNREVRNVCIVRKTSQEKSILMKKFVNSSIIKKDDFTRVYPYGSLAAHVLGFMNFNQIGVAGIEKEFNDELTGKDGKVYFERDAANRIIAVDENLSEKSKPGNTLYLTIDYTYQKILEEELSAGLKKYKGKQAVGIIMNPNNGEILALANLPTYDPQNIKLKTADARRDRALCDTYEPGSTMKPIVMSILLENNLVRENETVNTENGVYKLGRITIRDDHKYNKLTAAEVIEHSSNIGISKLVQRVDDNAFYKYLRDYGFGQTTSIGLPGEVDGRLKKPRNFQKVTKEFMSFGYEVAVTPIQLTTAYCALVNGGLLFQPHIWEKVVDVKGNIVEKEQPSLVRRVISKKTSDKIKSMLVGVVENGTGKEARLNNVRVGGKTGTSQQLIDGKYSKENYNTSFIGYFPTEHPNAVVYILVKSPQVKKYGGDVAAPIFRNVAKRLIEADLNLVPENMKIKREQNYFDNLRLKIASGSSKEKGFVTSDIGEIDKEKNPKKIIGSRTTMPNIKNITKREAISIASGLGLKYRAVGSGYVVFQSIEAGEKIKKGSFLIFQCKPKTKLKSLRIN